MKKLTREYSSLLWQYIDWRDPPLFAPDPMDEALKNFTYNPISERTRIVLLEEVDYEVCIAVINFEGTVTLLSVFS